MKLASKARLTQGERNYLNNCGDMRKLAKPDWADRLVQQKLYLGCVGDEQAIERNAAKLLRAERRRAVRKCRGSKWTNPAIVGGGYEYNRACDDCATAIAGGK